MYVLFIWLHWDEWDRVVALPRHKFVTGATLLQLQYTYVLTFLVSIGRRSFSKYGISYYTHSRLNRQIWYRHPNSEAGYDEIQNVQRHGFLFCGNYILKYW
jgi:hypothetical protein